MKGRIVYQSIGFSEVSLKWSRLAPNVFIKRDGTAYAFGNGVSCFEAFGRMNWISMDFACVWYRWIWLGRLRERALLNDFAWRYELP